MKGCAMKRRKAFDREYRLTQIVNKMAERYWKIQKDGVTVSEVAGWLDLSSTQVRKLMFHLVKQGVVIGHKEDYPGVCGYRIIFRFNDDYLRKWETKQYRAEPKPKRTIKINGLQTQIGEM